MAATMAHLPPNVDIGYRLEVGTTVTFICAFIVVSLRVVARSLYAKMSWDDYLMIFAVLQALIATIFDFIAVDHGLGRHIIYVTKDRLITAMFYDLLSQVFCINALTFAKISICLSYLRILSGTRHTFLRVTCYLTAFLVFAVNTVVIISLYAHCDPPHKSWNPWIPGKCWKSSVENGLILLQGAWSAVTDYFLSVLPLFILKDIQVSRNNKIVLCGLMGLGVVTGVFATIRTIETGLGLKKGTSDLSYTTLMGLMWAGMERNIAMLVASVPALRPLTGPVVNLTSQTMSYLGLRSSTDKSHSETGPSKGSFGAKSSQSTNNGNQYPMGYMNKNGIPTSSTEQIIPGHSSQRRDTSPVESAHPEHFV